MKKRIILKDPTSFSVYDLKINGKKRRILFIGEIHKFITCPKNPDNKMITLADFIEQYHRSIGNDKVLDIYGESGYIGRKSLGWIPTLRSLIHRTIHLDDEKALSYIRKKLVPCSPKYNFSLYQCPENIRVHLCDIRYMKRRDYGGLEEHIDMECYVDKLFRIGLLYANQTKTPKANYALSKLVSFTRNYLFEEGSPEYHTHLSEYIIEQSKIFKQISHIPSPKVRKKLTKWAHEAYDIRITDARRKLLFFEKIWKYEMDQMLGVDYVSHGCLNDFLNNISLSILYIISVFMDMFLVGRLLRDFVDGSYAKNAIVYTGQYHDNQYTKLMKIIGAKKVFSTNNIKEDGQCYESCVDITKFYNTEMSSDDSKTSVSRTKRKKKKNAK